MTLPNRCRVRLDGLLAAVTQALDESVGERHVASSTKQTAASAVELRRAGPDDPQRIRWGGEQPVGQLLRGRPNRRQCRPPRRALPEAATTSMSQPAAAAAA